VSFNLPTSRKRHISFQPISHHQTPTASPFVSPRTTPIPAMRSRHCSSGAVLPLHLLPGGGRSSGHNHGVNFNSAASDISLSANYGSESECSTPFISPHGTPIPFNRSRHSSAQGRLCRSRHSSGIAGPFGGKPYPAFCPLAFTNLNNPFSPQPTTPLLTYQDQVCEQIIISNGFIYIKHNVFFIIKGYFFLRNESKPKQ